VITKRPTLLRTMMRRSSQGVYESSGPGTVRLRDYPHDEYCLLAKGNLVIRDANGEEQRFRAGDSFVVTKGFNGEWIMETVIRKQFVVAEDVEADMAQAKPA